MIDVTDTAQPIAWIRAEEARLPPQERCFDDPYAHLFAGAGGATEVARRMTSVPGMRESVRLRTRYLDDAVRCAIDAGTRQVVLLGAGFDCRGLRMPEIAASGSRVFEVDFPEQLERKRARLAAGGVPLPAHVATIPCDLAAADAEEALTSALRAASHRAAEPSVFLWEGVVGYLDEAACDRTLALIGRLAGPGGRLAFNYSSGRFAEGDLPRRLAAAGLTLVEDVDSAALHARHLRGAPPPGLERFRLVTAVRADARRKAEDPPDRASN